MHHTHPTHIYFSCYPPKNWKYNVQEYFILGHDFNQYPLIKKTRNEIKQNGSLGRCYPPLSASSIPPFALARDPRSLPRENTDTRNNEKSSVDSAVFSFNPQFQWTTRTLNGAYTNAKVRGCHTYLCITHIFRCVLNAVTYISDIRTE
jgi:hypothetical protein